MTKFQEPNYPAIFTESYNTLRQFDKNLVTVLGELSLNLKAILDHGISISDNVDWVSISFTSSSTPDAENTIAHALGKIPEGFILYDIDKGAVVYRGTTSWTKTQIYLKVNTANVAIKAWIF